MGVFRTIRFCLSLATALGTGACFAPDIPSGTVLCGEAGCPSGMSCAEDGYCYSGGGPGSGVDANPDLFPAGAIMHFNRSSCPEGWRPLAEAAGRTIMVLPTQGAAGATVGDALPDLQTRIISRVPAHSHAYILGTGRTSDDLHSHELPSSTSHDGNGGSCDRVQEVSAVDRSILLSAESHGHTIDIPAFTSGEAGLAEVDVTMPYVQLLVCTKN